MHNDTNLQQTPTDVGIPEAETASPTGFADLGLSEASLAAVTAAGYLTPTPVQLQAIPPALEGRDVIGCAATGTGKTAAFLLPILDRLQGRGTSRVLILAPTRELVQQTAEAVRTFGARRGFRCVEIVGGLGFQPQIRGLREQRDVIVATPGRLLDHMAKGDARLDGIEILVLDEADRMLDLGFKAQLDRILARLPRERQTMLFSATMGREVADFAKRCLRDPIRVEIVRSGTLAARAEQCVYHVPQKAKTALLTSLLARDNDSTLVFTRTKHRAEKLARSLDRAGHRVARIHGDRSQAQRQAALEGFKNGSVRILVATDVAARGLDVEQIGHVVNFDLSQVPDDHVHRVGRTARASASGRASSFCSPEELDLLRQIERFTRSEIARAPLPEGIADRVLDQLEAASAPASAPVSDTPREERRPAPRPFAPKRRFGAPGGGSGGPWRPRFGGGPRGGNRSGGPRRYGR